MKTDIFHLQIIPIKDILVHEEFDKSRAFPLVESLKIDKIIANPIIVAAVDGKKYLQLDGMNRFSAFKMLKFTSILCQIIDYNDQETVELSSWSHLFAGKKQKFLTYIKSLNNISIKRGRAKDISHRYIKEEGLGRLCTIYFSPGEVYLIYCSGNLLNKIEFLNKIVSFYKENIVRDVLPSNPNESNIDILFQEHIETNTLVVFPTFTRHQIVEVVKKGKLLPAGISRHIIKRRCLNVNLPISFFTDFKSIRVQNEKLEENLASRKFRIYEEPTIYFE